MRLIKSTMLCKSFLAFSSKSNSAGIENLPVAGSKSNASTRADGFSTLISVGKFSLLFLNSLKAASIWLCKLPESSITWIAKSPGSPPSSFSNSFSLSLAMPNSVPISFISSSIANFLFSSVSALYASFNSFSLDVNLSTSFCAVT